MGIGDMRRRHQHHPFAGCTQPREGRPEQLQLADAFAGQKDLAERRLRPAAGRQRRIQRGMAGRLGAGHRRGRLAFPDAALVEQRIEGDDGAHQGHLMMGMELAMVEVGDCCMDIQFFTLAWRWSTSLGRRGALRPTVGAAS
ncbi:hypothetical protein D3C76_1282240 [compost metagenome]